mmetsp:Transcript_4634/g.13384  ORF Transcript_4634/g.13384 Transcript_4634/m.13384 type:complete len:234 (-) Transcript_4634:705-1406(-)
MGMALAASARATSPCFSKRVLIAPLSDAITAEGMDCRSIATALTIINSTLSCVRCVPNLLPLFVVLSFDALADLSLDLETRRKASSIAVGKGFPYWICASSMSMFSSISCGVIPSVIFCRFGVEFHFLVLWNDALANDVLDSSLDSDTSTKLSRFGFLPCFDESFAFVFFALLLVDGCASNDAAAFANRFLRSSVGGPKSAKLFMNCSAARFCSRSASVAFEASFIFCPISFR